MACPHNSTLLVVDDDPDIRETLQAVLEDEGYAVSTAADGRQALAALASCTPCMVILDLMMPVMDGWEVVARMLESPTLSSVPVCVVSATADMAPKATARVLQKPIDLDALLSAVREYCGDYLRSSP